MEPDPEPAEIRTTWPFAKIKCQRFTHSEAAAEAVLPSAEFILSGIPYTVLNPGVRHRILIATRDALGYAGLFVVYQYTRAVLPDLQAVFSRVDDDFEPLNILPARVFFCRK